MHLIKIILLIILYYVPCASFGANEQDNFFSKYNVNVGLNIYSTDFDVYIEGGINPIGTMSEEYSISPFINASSPYEFFENSDWGWFIDYNFTTFNLEQQIVNDSLVKLGTSVEGYDINISPTLFYSFSGKYINKKRGDSLLAGVGLGLGYLSVSGDVILTETTNQKLPIDINNLGMSIIIFFDYKFGNYKTRVSGGGTSYTKDGLEYDVFDFKISLSYLF